MINPQSHVASSKILNVPDGNWRVSLRQLKIKLYTSHGDAEKQIIDEQLIPLFPFATRPTNYDQESSINGSQILQLVYAHIPSTEAKPPDMTDSECFISLLDLPHIYSIFSSLSRVIAKTLRISSFQSIRGYTDQLILAADAERGFVRIEAFLSAGGRNNPLSRLIVLPKRSSVEDIPVLSLYEELSIL
jgi:hypothetical protein